MLCVVLERRRRVQAEKEKSASLIFMSRPFQHPARKHIIQACIHVNDPKKRNKKEITFTWVYKVHTRWRPQNCNNLFWQKIVVIVYISAFDGEMLFIPALFWDDPWNVSSDGRLYQLGWSSSGGLYDVVVTLCCPAARVYQERAIGICVLRLITRRWCTSSCCFVFIGKKHSLTKSVRKAVKKKTKEKRNKWGRAFSLIIDGRNVTMEEKTPAGGWCSTLMARALRCFSIKES